MVRRQQNIAWMGIGMEDAVNEDLLEVGAEQVVGERSTVDLGPFDPADRGDLRALDVVHRQHARRREVVDRQRDDDALEVAQLM